MLTTNNLQQLERQISAAMQADRHRLRGMARNIRRELKDGKPVDRNWQRFEDRLKKSLAISEARRLNVPRYSFPEDLPINSAREEIAEAIQQHPVIVVCGETGSGKSTQLPKICLEAGRGIAGMIGHTQPRRLAARSVAARLAEELGSKVGEHVGFKIRFTDNISAKSYVKLMTDGILLAETQGDRFLDAYDTIIIDEAHERSLNIDFLMGYLHRLLERRRDLRLIVTSATIDAERFADHFQHAGRPAPIIEVSGRSYPVEVRYRPATADEEGNLPDPLDGIVDAAEELCREGGGDILVFLPTERDIRDVAKRLRGWSLHRGDRPAILPLYSRLPTSEQDRIFHPGGGRRVVLATNVAESSITVPGIRYVIDSGTARISRYAPRSKVQRLPIEAVSQASADQRKGRCGRVAPGICIRLYDEKDFLARKRYTTPEIRRTNLAAVILRMLALNLGDIDLFPFLDPPQSEAVRDGFRTLYELGATDSNHSLTEIGRRMSRLPVDPRIARMILSGADENCLADILIIASALEIQDPRDRPAEKEKQADASHERFADSSSDFISYLKLWDHFHEEKEKLSRSQLRRACRDQFISYNRLREWLDVHRQLKQLVEESGLKVKRRQEDYAPLHRALLSGLLSNVAKRIDKRTYQGMDGIKSYLWPGSHLFQEGPEWVVAAEVVETSQRYLRTAARISRNWIEPLANHLVDRDYRNPHWSRKRDTVLATEKVSLYRLPVSSKRGQKYGPVDPAVARHLFIRHALVQGDFQSKIEFFVHNRELIEGLALQAAKSRNPGLLVSDAVQYQFYDHRLPPEVFDTRSLRRWMKRAKQEETDRLFMRPSDVLDEDPDASEPDDFPDTVQAGELALRLDYRFEPGEEDDGASVTVPVEALEQLETYQLEWGVPGLLHEKVTALIRTLPKATRRNLIPAPDVAKDAVAMIEFGAGPFLPTVADALSRLSGERIVAADFQPESLPQHLSLNIRVVNGDGDVMTRGRDLNELRREVGVDASAGETRLSDPGWQKDGLTKWDFGELPERVMLDRGGFKISAFPMLVDERDSISIRLAGNKELADFETRRGVRRLVVFREKQELAEQIHWLPKLDEISLLSSTIGAPFDLREQLSELLAGLAFVEGQPLPRDEQQFDALRERGREQLPAAVQDLLKLVLPLFERYHQARLAVENVAASKLRPSVQDMEQQIAELTTPFFLSETPLKWLSEYARYFEAIVMRIERMKSGNQQKDLDLTQHLHSLWSNYVERREEHARRGLVDPELQQYRWMMEEYRVSQFAQRLGTALKISDERLEKQWLKTKI